MSYSIVAGNLEPDLYLTVKVNGIAQSLVGATDVSMLWQKPDGSEEVVALTEVNYTQGRVKRAWVEGDTDMVGRHRGRVIVTWADDEEQTFPSTGGWFTWYVRA